MRSSGELSPGAPRFSGRRGWSRSNESGRRGGCKPRAGMWAPQVARLGGAELPIVPLQHHYLVTDALRELDDLGRELPVLRDADGSYYVRQEGLGLLVGPFERNPKP